MIHVTRLNQTRMVLNSDLIEHVEMTPDTVISLTTGQKIRVVETAEEIVDRVVKFRRSFIAGAGLVFRQPIEMTLPKASSKEN